MYHIGRHVQQEVGSEREVWMGAIKGHSYFMDLLSEDNNHVAKSVDMS